MIRSRIVSMGLMAFVSIMATSGAVADEETGWSGELNAGLSAQTGTSDTLAGTLDATGARKWENDEATVRFNATFGTSRNRDRTNSNNEKTNTIQDSQGLFGVWKHDIHKRFFWNSETEISRDSTQNRDIRVRFDTGPGYRAWKGADAAKEHFDVNAGIGYRYEVYDGNANDGPTGADKDEDQFVDLVGGFEYKNGLFEDRVEWTHTGEVFVPANDFESFVVRTEGIIGIPLTEAWSFRTSFLYEYVNRVPDGTSKSTTRTSVGLGYKF